MKKKIPKAESLNQNRINSPKKPEEDDIVKFSFARFENNEYFGLDSTCDRWAKDLFEILKIVSGYHLKDIYAGKYSESTLRIHNHSNAKPPCEVPKNIELEEMWQIRISKSKGGIHGVFVESIFYIIWFDPLHNLYPNEHYGGLKKISQVESCCKDRELELEKLNMENKKMKQENSSLMELLDIRTSI